MFLIFLLSLLFAALVTAAPTRRSTNQWFTVEWDAPEFTAMSGDLVVPSSSNNHGITSVWPGLQGDEAVLQAALSGQQGSWSLRDSFYGSTDVSLGPRVQVSPGDKVHFSFTRVSDSVWMCTLSGPDSTTETFSLPAKSLNRAIFAVNLVGSQHDFTVSYADVAITATTPAAEWCTTTASNGYDTGHGSYTVKDAVADGTTCRIGKITLPETS